MEQRYIEKGSSDYKRAIAVLFLGSIVAFGTEYCLQPIIPVLAQEFQLMPATASLAMSFGTGGMAFAMLLIAGMASRLERKKTMTAALVGASLLAIGMAVSYSFGFILCLRLCQGILLAGFPALAIAYINEEFDPKIVGLVVGIYVSGSAIGGLFGRLMISTLTDLFSWRYGLGAAGLLYLLIGILFWFCLPSSTKKIEATAKPIHFFGDMKKMLGNPTLLGVYMVAFAVMGAFVCTYNYISYVFMAPPYNLSQTAIGFVFTLYLIGMVASTVMGGMADRHGGGKILCVSILLMLLGIVITLAASLVLKIIGLAFFTYGFFGAHSTACSWAGKAAPGDKAQASSMYMLFYYAGASVVGTAGGTFLSQDGWNGVVGFLSVVIIMALLVALKLTLHKLPLLPLKSYKKKHKEVS